MPHLERDGVRIFYQEDGAGPAILFTHGFGASSHMFEPQVPALSGTHRMIRWDMRGHGETDSPDDPAAYSEDASVGDMVALLDHCGAKRAILAGMSLGGTYSLALALRYPERVRALILIDSGPGFKSEGPRERWNSYAEGVAQAVEKEGLGVLSQSTEIAVQRHRSARGIAMAARGMMKQQGTHLIESLGKIDVPTLILVGSEDHAFLGAADAMAAKIPNATRHVIPNAGHAANMDQPDIVNDLIQKFLAGLDS